MTDNGKVYVTSAQVISYLSPRLRGAVQSLSGSDTYRIQEIRLRAGRPLAVSINGKEKFVTMAGKLTAYPDEGVKVLRTEIEETFRAVCEYSVYSYQKELREGYVTLKGGARVGISGTAVYENGRLTSMRNISSMAFRVPREVKNSAAALASLSFKGLLIAGTAGSGKTTVLRDLCRLLGSERRVSLVDSRGEIAGMLHGMPQFEIGLHTDVFDGFPRDIGSMTALRSMTPEYIVCDEIGTHEDTEALMQICGCGVSIIASAHGGSVDDILRRDAILPLIEAGVFSHIAMLESASAPGRIKKITDLRIA